jgi:cell wall-associated NlpC family hydrolase
MEFGVCLLSIIPVRKEPADISEMVTQIQFGELVSINQKQDNWMHIRNVYDNYEGWIDEKQITIMDEHEFNHLGRIVPSYTTDVVEIVFDKDDKVAIPVLFGSVIYELVDEEFTIANRLFQYSGQLSTPKSNVTANSVLEDAMLFLNAPYLWGGKSPFGIDCSGLTQLVFKVHGIELLRDANQQATQGETIGLFDEAQPGDLLFFDNAEGEIVHVGMLMSDHKIIHASGMVRIDSIDHQGIYNKDLKKYTHNLRLIKRIL